MEKQKLNKENNIFLKNKKLKVILPLSISFGLVFIIAFISLTYSWIFSTYFSDIVGINLSLIESQGLVMIMNGEVTQSIDINAYLGGSLSTFALNEVSSSNGRDMFLRDVSTYYIDEDNIYENIDVARDNTGIIKFREATSNDYNNSFIYFNFTLESTGDNRYLIFDSNNSFIKDDNFNSIYPIRVSMTFVDGESVATQILGNRQEYLGNYYTEAVSSIDNDTKVGYTTDQNVESFEAFNGYFGGVFDADKTLYYLEEGVQIGVIVRIWLEGGDPLCVDSMGGSSLNIALRFDSIAESEVI